MAVKVRLRRAGGRKVPFYRVVAADQRFAPTGRFLENLGWYDPKQKGQNFSINLDRIQYWVDRGAHISETVRSLMRRAKSEPAAASVSEPSAR